MGLLQTKKLPHSKRNHQENAKATYKMGESICEPHISEKGLMSGSLKRVIS